MGTKLDSRKRLFDKFSNQLHLLKENGLINIDLKFDKTYICPICLDQFQEKDIISSSTNFLTEEDAPPAKLGGKRIVLTCKDCNSTAGHQIDNHLVNRIRENDENSFYKGTKQYRNIEFEGQNITAEITSNGDGTLRVFHKSKNNNPSLLDKFVYGIKNKTVGPFLNLERKDYQVNSERVNLALLKTSYIITFSKFGYIFLLDDFFNPIRNQIRDMNVGYESHIFLSKQLETNNSGSYYVMNTGAKSIFNVFTLSTEYSQTVISSFIPMPNLTPEQIFENLTKTGYSVNEPGKVGVNLDVRNYDPYANLFNDITEIKKIINWVQK
jgi:hypothetical protein